MASVNKNYPRWILGDAASDEWISPRFVFLVVALCLLPATLTAFRVHFTLSPAEIRDHLAASIGREPDEVERYLKMRGDFMHLLFQWTGVCLAFMTAAIAILHYTVKRDVATPIVGMALLCCGMLDAFHSLTASWLIAIAGDHDRFVPFTWALSRIFHASILAIGAGAVLLRGRSLRLKDGERTRLLMLVPVLFAVIAYGIIHVCAVAPVLPVTYYPDGIIRRPWDAVALVIYLFAGGILLPRFHQQHASLFSQGLMLSLVPHILSQMCAGFWSSADIDDGFIAAQYLKLVGYGVPLLGLMLDYVRAYQAEAELLVTQEKLDIARQIQKGLLPQRPPRIAGFDVAGRSDSPAAVGGDYFDFVQMIDGSWLIVLGDVSGHDLGASLLMSQTRAYLRALASKATELLPLIQELNRFLAVDVRERRFVSLVLIRIWPNSNKMEYVTAGLSGMMIPVSSEPRPLNVTAPVLGITDCDAAACDYEVFVDNDLLALYSDGLTEARNRAGEMFGLDRLLKTLREYRDLSSDALAQRTTEIVAQFTGELGIEDDLTLVILKRMPT